VLLQNVFVPWFWLEINASIDECKLFVTKHKYFNTVLKVYLFSCYLLISEHFGENRVML